jgi:hypothetical protein
MNSFYNDEQIQESITGYLWYDAPWTILRNVYPYISGDTLIDVGSGPAIFPKVFMALKQGENDYHFKAWGVEAECFHIADTILTSHVIEHLTQKEARALVKETIQKACKRIIHVVPDGNVQDKNMGTIHLVTYNRLNFLNLFKEYEDKGILKRVAFHPIKGDRMDSLVYVGDVV